MHRVSVNRSLILAGVAGAVALLAAIVVLTAVVTSTSHGQDPTAQSAAGSEPTPTTSRKDCQITVSSGGKSVVFVLEDGKSMDVKEDGKTKTYKCSDGLLILTKTKEPLKSPIPGVKSKPISHK